MMASSHRVGLVADSVPNVVPPPVGTRDVELVPAPVPLNTAAHSSSFVDGALVAMGVSIPTGYQFLFAPLRVIYAVAGPAAMKFLQRHVIDSVVAVGDRGAARTAGAALIAGVLAPVALPAIIIIIIIITVCI